MADSAKQRLEDALKKHLVRRDNLGLCLANTQPSIATPPKIFAYLRTIGPDKDFLCLAVRKGLDDAERLTSSQKIQLLFPEEGLVAVCSVIHSLNSRRELVISYPQDFLTQERRGKGRIYNPNLLVSFHGKLELCKKCYDFGLGGFAVLFNKRERIPCELEDRVSVEFFVRDKFFLYIEAILVHVATIAPFESIHYPYGGQRASFKWKSVSERQRQVLKEMMKVLRAEESSSEGNDESDPPKSLALVK